MVFCTGCGKESETEDAFCRGCGARLRELPKNKSPIEETLKELRDFVDTVASEIKKQLLGQIDEIDKGFASGKMSEDEFMAEAEEIRNRLRNFTEG